MRKSHAWKSDPKRSSRGHRVAVCEDCGVVREDTSCRGRHVRYAVDGKWVVRAPKCEVK